MQVPTFQHPCSNKGGEATFYLLSCQVHGDGVSPKSSAKRSPIDPTHCHRKGNKWPGTGLIPALPLSPVLGAATGRGTLATAHGHGSSFAPESICSYFWAVTAFPNICLGVSAWPRSQLGLPPLLAAVQSGTLPAVASFMQPCDTSMCRIPPLPMGHFSHPPPHSRSRVHRESPRACLQA